MMQPIKEKPRPRPPPCPYGFDTTKYFKWFQREFNNIDPFDISLLDEEEEVLSRIEITCLYLKELVQLRGLVANWLLNLDNIQSYTPTHFYYTEFMLEFIDSIPLTKQLSKARKMDDTEEICTLITKILYLKVLLKEKYKKIKI